MGQPLNYLLQNDLEKCPVEKLIAACLAYIWIVYLGALGEKEGWRELIHRRKRCDLSLFQLGLRLLEHFLNEDLPIPVQFHVTI